MLATRGVLFLGFGYPRRAAAHLNYPHPPRISYGLPATHKYPLPASTHKYKYLPFAPIAELDAVNEFVSIAHKLYYTCNYTNI